MKLPVAAVPAAPASLFRQGLLSAVTNPKGLLFFAAFLPQFVDPTRNLFLQFAIMAGTFAGIAMALNALLTAILVPALLSLLLPR